ncbi:MAG: hypothetical protein KIS92_07180 [Planctomycetota bacterium]|nr:hypothetical protein [Planctomycetota bacterium]
MSKRSEWTWKTGDAEVDARLHLKYEPGNWGDVLKGAWLTVVAGALATQAGRRPLKCLDPFAGAPSYPLLPASAERLVRLPENEHTAVLRAFAARNEWPSCATVCAEVLRKHGAIPRLAVFDENERARGLWAKHPDAQVLSLASGYDAFEKAFRGKVAPDLVLVDSYDFFDRWGKVLDALAALGRKVPVLVYVFNTAPRGPGFQSQYDRLRKKLIQTAQDLGPVPLGRLPYDKHENQAHHEVFLLAPAAFTQSVQAELAQASAVLASLHADAGAYELLS